LRARWVKPPLDIDEVAATAELGCFDERAPRDVCGRSGQPKPDADLSSLLEVDSLALVAFRGQPHLHLFSEDGVRRGIVPLRLQRDGRPAGRVDFLYFMDCTGVAFTMRHWVQEPTSAFGGATAADVWSGRHGDLIGSFDQTRTREQDNTAYPIWMVHKWLPQAVSDIRLAVSDNREGRVLSPHGRVRAIYRNSEGETQLVSDEGWVWGHLRGGARGMCAWVRWVRFSSDAPPDVRAITIAGELCRQIQHFKDGDVG
jgi:hypothetical protein